MNWLEPWIGVDDLGPQFAASFEAQLGREASEGHPLFGTPVAAVGKWDGADDVLFQLLDGTSRVAVVHLTFSGNPQSPPWPWCVMYPSLEAWATEGMKPDHDEYRAMREAPNAPNYSPNGWS